MTKKYNIGIALGGGGARGFAHLGVLKALEEKGIKPDVIAGTSAGSLVGVFIAAGKTPDETMKLMKENNITDYAKVVLPVNGLLSLDNLETILKRHIDAETFEELDLPFFATVSALKEGKVVYQNKGKLIPFVKASASIPILFSPVKIEDECYVDGGLLDNLPIQPLMNCCKKIIAVSISPIQEVEEIDNLVGVAARTFQLSVNSQLHKIEENADLFIEPEGLEKYDILNTRHADELFEIGYKHTKELNLDGFN
ncbi:MAG: patatin-like phospholipase family protein [Bacteroidota bacterium]